MVQVVQRTIHKHVGRDWFQGGKIVFIIELINNIAKIHEGVSVFGKVNEHTHRRNDFYMEMKEFKVINN